MRNSTKKNHLYANYYLLITPYTSRIFSRKRLTNTHHYAGKKLHSNVVTRIALMLYRVIKQVIKLASSDVNFGIKAFKST